jgi:Na+-transporting methylmalonyl-CoA/oxaloacetate decarboxylase gamma subunit
VPAQQPYDTHGTPPDTEDDEDGPRHLVITGIAERAPLAALSAAARRAIASLRATTVRTRLAVGMAAVFLLLALIVVAVAAFGSGDGGGAELAGSTSPPVTEPPATGPTVAPSTDTSERSTTTASTTTTAPTTTTTAPTTTTTAPTAPTATPSTPPSSPARTGNTQPSTTEPPQNRVYYRNCGEVWRDGTAPLRQGEPGYRSELDRNGDGVACWWGGWDRDGD